MKEKKPKASPRKRPRQPVYYDAKWARCRDPELTPDQIGRLPKAMEEHLPKHDKTLLAVQLEATENYFLVIFSVELALKIIALGFILHPGSYLR